MPVDSKISCLIGESVLPGDSENPQIRLAPNLCTTNGRCPSRLLPCLYRLCARYEQVRLFVSRLYFVSACVGCDGSKFKEIIWSYAVRTGILGTTMRVGRLKCESLWGATWSQPVAAAVWLLRKLSSEHELLESLFGMMRCIARKKWRQYQYFMHWSHRHTRVWCTHVHCDGTQNVTVSDCVCDWCLCVGAGCVSVSASTNARVRLRILKDQKSQKVVLNSVQVVLSSQVQLSCTNVLI